MADAIAKFLTKELVFTKDDCYALIVCIIIKEKLQATNNTINIELIKGYRHDAESYTDHYWLRINGFLYDAGITIIKKIGKDTRRTIAVNKPNLLKNDTNDQKIERKCMKKLYNVYLTYGITSFNIGGLLLSSNARYLIRRYLNVF